MNLLACYEINNKSVLLSFQNWWAEEAQKRWGLTPVEGVHTQYVSSYISAVLFFLNNW